MRVSQFMLNTLKETPADAETISHQLMLRAGLIRRLAAGLYSWLPLGLRTLRKVEHIVREEMNRAGALEVLMPVVQPAELWQESTRWDVYGPDLLRIKDRHHRDFCLGPTHEEIITDLVRREIRSYKQLPLNLYQIQTKFRDEIRPRFGVMRAREFIMKDAYSFHVNEQSLQETYQVMYDTYCRIFHRIGLNFRPVKADSGNIGGDASHEFHVLADSGEDAIAFSDGSDYAANVELAVALLPVEPRPPACENLTKVATPGKHSIEDICTLLNIPPQKTLKALFVAGTQSPAVALLLRGDHELNTVKVAKLPQVAFPLKLLNTTTLIDLLQCPPGSLGPVGLNNIPIIADHAALHLADFVCGANAEGYHYTGVNWERDLPVAQAADIRKVVNGDLSPDGKGRLAIARGIEVGHIFQLGTKYSKTMNALCLDEHGQQVNMQMGCYGIGVSRIVAATIEQNHDERGIAWPSAICPFQVTLLPMNMQKSQRLREAAETLYQQLEAAGLEVLFDDRPVRAGVMFADMDLIGIPHRIVLGERSLDQGVIEYKQRHDEKTQEIPLANAISFLKAQVFG